LLVVFGFLGPQAWSVDFADAVLGKVEMVERTISVHMPEDGKLCEKNLKIASFVAAPSTGNIHAKWACTVERPSVHFVEELARRYESTVLFSTANGQGFKQVTVSPLATGYALQFEELVITGFPRRMDQSTYDNPGVRSRILRAM